MPDRGASTRWAAVALTALLISAASAPALAAFDEEQYDLAISTLRCDCGCHPQSLKDCACGYAAGKRDQIYERMQREDMDGDALIAAWVDEFGEQILIAPKAAGFNLVAWLGPLAGLVVAMAMMAWLLVRWRSRWEHVTTPATADPAPADDPYFDRLQKKLQEME